MKRKSTLRKIYPADDGWIIATMELRAGAVVTVDEFRAFAGKDAEIPYFKQRGNRLVAVYREARRKPLDPELVAHIRRNLERPIKTAQPDKGTLRVIRDVPLQEGDYAVECSNPGHLLKVHPSEFGKPASHPAYSYFRSKEPPVPEPRTNHGAPVPL